jgi:ribosomal protein L13E
LPEFDITSMVQVSNPALASKYADYRHRLASRCNGNPNERIMFHFPSDSAITKIWQEGEGHDPRLSVWAEVGKGAYFSEHAMYGYAYKYNLWPSPPKFEVKPEPPIGATMIVFATLVCLGNVADVGAGCESCPSPVWDAWKKEFEYQKSAENRSPKPTRPPAMPLPSDAAQRQQLLDLMQVKDAPRYDSVTSTEGDLATHPASTNTTAAGQRMCDVMHPRLRDRAAEWSRQYVLFEAQNSYPMFIMTLTKTGASPMGVLQLKAAGCDVPRIRALGFTALQFKDAGFEVQELKGGGFSSQELMSAGYDLSALIGAGFSVGEMKGLGVTALQLKDAGFGVQELKGGRFSLQELISTGYDLSALIGAGFSVGEMKGSGITALQLKESGCSVSKLVGSAFSNPELQAAGFSLAEIFSIVAADADPATLAQAQLYYRDVEFASQLCSEFAAAERGDAELSSRLSQAHDALQLIVDHNPLLRFPPSGRQPVWPRHEALLRFDLPLQRLTTQYMFTKKWVPRFFVLRGSRLYYSNGESSHTDALEGSLAFMRSNPAPDGDYCLDLKGA